MAKGKVALAASFVLTRDFQNIFLIGRPWFHHLETILSCQSRGKAVEKDSTLSPLLNLASNTLLVTVVCLLSVGVIKRVSKTIKSKPTLKEEVKKANYSQEKLEPKPESSILQNPGQMKGKKTPKYLLGHLFQSQTLLKAFLPSIQWPKAKSHWPRPSSSAVTFEIYF